MGTYCKVIVLMRDDRGELELPENVMPQVDKNQLRLKLEQIQKESYAKNMEELERRVDQELNKILKVWVHACLYSDSHYHYRQLSRI